MKKIEEPIYTQYEEQFLNLEEDARLEFRLIENKSCGCETQRLDLTLNAGMGFYPTTISLGNINNEQLSEISDIFHKLSQKCKE